MTTVKSRVAAIDLQPGDVIDALQLWGPFPDIDECIAAVEEVALYPELHGLMYVRLRTLSIDGSEVDAYGEPWGQISLLKLDANTTFTTFTERRPPPDFVTYLGFFVFMFCLGYVYLATTGGVR